MSRFSLTPSLSLVGLSGVLWGLTAALGLPVRADVPLTRADIESLYNQVDLIADGQAARPASLSDWLAVGDALRTSLGARAELRFNDGSLARVGERATFWFVPNTRDFRLSNGTALFLIPPGQGPSNIQTPSAVTGIQGTALVVRHIPRPDCEQSSLSLDELACPGRTIVMVLTDSPKGPVEVSTDSGNSAALSAGDLAVIENDAIQVVEFNLQLFYETSPLVEGLDLNNPDFEGTGAPTDPVRQETWDGIQSQRGFEGNYLLNPDLVSIDAQLGVATSWLLPADGSGNTFQVNVMTDRVSDISSVREQRSPRNAEAQALMSSWFSNNSSRLSSPQAAVPGILTPPGERRPTGGMEAIAPVGNPNAPTPANGGQIPNPATSQPPSTQGPAPSAPATESPSVQPSFDPGGGGGVMPNQPNNNPVQPPSPGAGPTPPSFDPGGGGGIMPNQPNNNPVQPPSPGAGPTPPVQPGGPGSTPTMPEPPSNPVEPPGGAPGGPTTPDAPFDPGGGPTQPPGAGEPPIEPPVMPPTDGFNPPGNPEPPGNPNVTPPGQPEQPQGVPFDPGGGPTPAPAPDAAGGGASGGGPTVPTPEASPIAPPVETVPEAAGPNEFPGDVLLDPNQPADDTEAPSSDPPTSEPSTGEAGIGTD